MTPLAVFYDDSLTDAFFETVLRLLKPGMERVLVLAVEKRLVGFLSHRRQLD